jgi:mannitol 2-dehydrogenase
VTPLSARTLPALGGVLPADRRMLEVMAAQDCLYSLVVKHPDGGLDARVIGSIVEYLFAPDDPDAVVAKMPAPETRIGDLVDDERFTSSYRDTLASLCTLGTRASLEAGVRG